ncbi:hypothetical protein CY35_05G008900 [Sphagnum magellanicum]|nr:hypothetical protein CY35_05G008900 [Sphagnum magellanicum]
MVTVAGARMQGGWGPASWLLTVIALLAILQLHNMDQNGTSECIQEGAQLTFPMPSYPILSPPIAHVSSHLCPREPPSK